MFVFKYTSNFSDFVEVPQGVVDDLKRLAFRIEEKVHCNEAGEDVAKIIFTELLKYTIEEDDK